MFVKYTKADVGMVVRILPQNITSYDLLKTLALLLMVVDHIGYYFFPEQLWFRTIGRLCVPIWFFLIGYARTRDLPQKMWSGGVILVFANFVSGISLFPLNILATMIILRLSIDFVIRHYMKSKTHIYVISAILLVLIIPTSILFEYGTSAFIMTMYGYFVRNRGEGQGDYNDSFIRGFMIFSFVSFIISQQLFFGFSVNQFTFLISGVLLVNIILPSFKSSEYPKLTNIVPNLLGGVIRFCGRNTLEVYVIHLVMFKLFALLLGYDGYNLFEFELVDLSMFDM